MAAPGATMVIGAPGAGGAAGSYNVAASARPSSAGIVSSRLATLAAGLSSGVARALMTAPPEVDVNVNIAQRPARRNYFAPRLAERPPIPYKAPHNILQPWGLPGSRGGFIAVRACRKPYAYQES